MQIFVRTFQGNALRSARQIRSGMDPSCKKALVYPFERNCKFLPAQVRTCAYSPLYVCLNGPVKVHFRQVKSGLDPGQVVRAFALYQR